MNFVEPYNRKDKIRRFLFQIVWTIFARPFPRATLRVWNIFILRLFGAKVSWKSVIYSKTKIIIPKNLVVDDYACIADDTIIENAAIVHLKEYAIVSQYSYLCTASHDIRDENFPQISKPIIIGKGAWVAARSFIGPGVNIGDNAVVGATSSVYKDVPENTVVGGNPAKFINKRYSNENY